MSLPKRDKSNLPARRLPSRNAMTHGVFSAIEILPWENPDAFDQLRHDLWQEHNPEGPTQEDCVETILLCRWRKMRLRAWRRFQTSAALNKPEHHLLRSEPPPPLFDTKNEGIIYALKMVLDRPKGPRIRDPDLIAEDHLRSFSLSFYRDQDSRSANFSLKLLPEEFRNHLRQKVPETAYESTEAWIVALKKEVETVLLPRVASRNSTPKIDHYSEVAAEFLGSDQMAEDLQVEEKLDAAIDRALRRLFWLKAQKELERERAQKIVNGKVTSTPSR